jgi:uncharacterized metal-binding protein
MYTCSMCREKFCDIGELDKAPNNCPSKDKEEIAKYKELYKQEENYNIAYNSAIVEAECYSRKTRIEETIEFARRCGYKNLGLAFCIGFSNEAKELSKVLKHNGFVVNSVACKNCSIPKEFIEIKEDEKLSPGSFEPMCNPIGQAHFLNKEKTDLNIVIGLCIGHDTLFLKYSNAPVTVLAVKDRVLAHNPLGALYLSGSYYKKKLYK